MESVMGLQLTMRADPATSVPSSNWGIYATCGTLSGKPILRANLAMKD